MTEPTPETETELETDPGPEPDTGPELGEIEPDGPPEIDGANLEPDPGLTGDEPARDETDRWVDPNG